MSNKLSNLIKFIKEDKEHKLSMVPQGIEIWFQSTQELPRFRYMAKDEVEAQFILDILEGYDRALKEFLLLKKGEEKVESSYGIRVFNSDTNNWADLMVKGGIKIRWADEE